MLAVFTVAINNTVSRCVERWANAPTTLEQIEGPLELLRSTPPQSTQLSQSTNRNAIERERTVALLVHLHTTATESDEILLKRVKPIRNACRDCMTHAIGVHHRCDNKCAKCGNTKTRFRVHSKMRSEQPQPSFKLTLHECNELSCFSGISRRTLCMGRADDDNRARCSHSDLLQTIM